MIEIFIFSVRECTRITIVHWIRQIIYLSQDFNFRYKVESIDWVCPTLEDEFIEKLIGKKAIR